MKNKKVNEEDLLNGWLKYHSITYKEVKEQHPEWMENPREYMRDFYSTYSVTQEQHDEWLKWAKEYTKKVTGIKGRLFEKAWAWVYLNVAPSIIKTE